jgi:hypothetical protein
LEDLLLESRRLLRVAVSTAESVPQLFPVFREGKRSDVPWINPTIG